MYTIIYITRPRTSLFLSNLQSLTQHQLSQQSSLFNSLPRLSLSSPILSGIFPPTKQTATMKFITAVSFLAAAVSGQRAVVTNNCDATVFIQSWPFDGSATGPLTTVRKGQTFSEDLRRSGSTIKISKAKNLDQPLFLGYSFSKNPDYAYYELNTYVLLLSLPPSLLLPLHTHTHTSKNTSC